MVKTVRFYVAVVFIVVFIVVALSSCKRDNALGERQGYRNAVVGITPMSLSGAWLGEYAYDGDAYRPVTLMLVLRVDENGVVMGDILEPNTFGEKSTVSLLSTVLGNVVDDGAQLTFQYSGNGGVSHSVANHLKWDSGEKLKGRWAIGNFRGSISLRKLSDLHYEQELGPVSNDEALFSGSE